MAPRSMLDSSYIVEGTDEPEEEPAEAPAPAEGEAPAEEAPAEQAAKTPIGRRAKAQARQDELLSELKSMRETITKQGETYSEKLARLQQENAEIRGNLQGYMSRPQEPQRREEPANPDKLLEEANAALDGKDFAKYQKKYADYIEARVAPKFAQQPAPQQPQLNPMLQVVAGQYADVMTDRAGLEIAQAHDRILQAQGVPDGPDRWKRAFDEGRRYLGTKGKPAPQTFSTKSRDVLSSVPTQRNSAPGKGGGEPGVRLTAFERETAKKFKMTDDEYATHLAAMHPERVENE